MRDYFKAVTPKRSRSSIPSTQRLSSSRASSEAFWDPGNDGPKGLVAEGVPSHLQRASEVYISGRTSTGRAREEQERGRPLHRKPVPNGAPSAVTSSTTTTTTHNQNHTGLIAPTDRDRNLDRLVQQRNGSDNPQPPASGLDQQNDNLPPYSDGVPSKGLFSRTKGHYRVAGASMLPIAKLPDQYSKMSDKDAKIEHLDGARGAPPPVAMTSALGGRAAPPTKGQRLKAHLKKWWWVHLLIGIIIIIVVVIIM